MTGPTSLEGPSPRVTDDVSRHLGWCLQRLSELGHAYGDMDAHDLLWKGCTLSGVDVAARQWLLHLTTKLLKGPFKHAERTLVGLPREWYDHKTSGTTGSSSGATGSHYVASRSNSGTTGSSFSAAGPS
ncbi:hypothetical protein TSOC_005263 [Tetrabaena socialis]|uniref:Uncharacterized protein n=1 Tax=Tetrabaena socialis TaxID=47790 RepID=A0A2J8A6N2_9CHLO|nr:hypothetical protein TSOC_005263 [Tetrabaena socialis]|eukprot:PNH08178.1 hypothetical protein TSOC_005263 [Tetrabaena socialis]